MCHYAAHSTCAHVRQRLVCLLGCTEAWRRQARIKTIAPLKQTKIPEQGLRRDAWLVRTRSASDVIQVHISSLSCAPEPKYRPRMQAPASLKPNGLTTKKHNWNNDDQHDRNTSNARVAVASVWQSLGEGEEGDSVCCRSSATPT